MKREPIAKIAEVNPSANGAMRLPTKTPVSFLPMSAVSENGYVLEEQERLLGDVLKGYTAFQRGDLLVAKITPCMENGKAAYLEHLEHEYGFGSTEFHVIRPKPGILGKYLFYMLWNPAFRAQAAMCMTGSAGQKRVPSNFVERFTIPVPETENEQRRIADILDEADALRRQRVEAIRVANDLPYALYQELLGSPLAKAWPVVPLDEAVELINGRAFKASDWGDQGLPIIRIQNLKEPTAPYNYYAGDYEARHRVADGDVLLSWSGQLVSFGVFIWDRGPGVLNQHIFRVVPRVLLSRHYLRHALLGIIGQAKHSFHGIEMKHLTKRELHSYSIGIPPRDVQDGFELRLAQHAEMVKDLESSATELDNLFHSLLQRAFRGEL